MTDEQDPISGHEVAQMYLSRYAEPNQPGSRPHRWQEHYKLRLAYENQMLESEGGTVAAVEMEIGGFIGSMQIWKVNKSPATRRVVSVGVWASHPWRTDKDGQPIQGIQNVNIERLGESAYRAPTDEEREAFKAKHDAFKAKKKARNTGKPKLINPTREAAQELQDALNREAAEEYKSRYSTEPDPVEIVEMTQAKYSALSKGTYAPCKAYYLHADGTLSNPEYRNRSESPIICKIRRAKSSAYCSDRVIVLTDKPQKPLPNWKQEQPEQAQELEPVPASLF